MARITLPFLGRTQHLLDLEEGLRLAQDGRNLVLVVEGGAGTGKSRLLDDFELHLATENCELRRGNAFPGATTRPGTLAELIRLDEIDDDRPVVLLVDDVQWADPTSLTAIRSLLVRPRTHGLLVVLTHRPLGAREAPGLRRLLEMLERREALRHLRLSPLSSSDLSEIAGGPDPTALAERLAVASGGIPLALEELIDQLVDAGALQREGDRFTPVRPLPEWPAITSLHERVARLPADQRGLVHTVALAGRPLPLPVVALLLDQEQSEALETAERLVDQGLLAEDPDGFRARTAAEAESLEAELGEVRKGQVFAELADAMSQAGFDEHEPGLVGTYYLRARRWEEAAPRLTETGLQAARRNAYAEALPLVSGALEALVHLGSADAELEGRLYFARAQCHRMLGWSDLAAEDAAEAARLLTGDERLRAMGWQAQVADDMQRATEGEWLTALAEYEAAVLGDRAGLGALLTLRAKMLGRLGLPAEADACLRRGVRLLRMYGNPYERFLGRWNGAWLAFDRGQMREAEAAFESCVDQVGGFEGEEWLADAEAWWARSLFWTGRIEQALEVHRRAIDAADRTDSRGAVFLATVGLTEGMILLGRTDDALEAARTSVQIGLQQLPAWENVVRYLHASALLSAGLTEEAGEEAERALAACPPGADGERWRTACRALLLEMRAGAEPWPRVEAARLTRDLLAARWFVPAMRLLVARARHENDREVALQAAALARALGVPMLAARAVTAGGLWSDPASQPVVADLQEMARRLPEDWRGAWESLPEVAPAIGAPVPAVDDRHEAATQLRAALYDLLETVSLEPKDLSEPHGEWTIALPRTPEEARRRRFATTMAGVAAAVVLGGGVAVAALVSDTVDDEPPPQAVGETILGQLRLERAEILGEWNLGGDPTRTGVTERSGVPELGGIYWELCTGASVRSSPAVSGQYLVVGSDDGNLYRVDSRNGVQVWRRPTDGPVRSSPSIAGAVGAGGLAGVDNMVFVGSDDNTVRGWTIAGVERWRFETGGRVDSSPLVYEGVVYVGSRDGHLYALAADTGDEIWRFPRDEPVGPISSSPAVHGDHVYVGSHDGNLYAVDRASGTLVWPFPTAAPIESTPVVHDGVVYVGSLDQSVWAVDVGIGRQVGAYPTDTPVRTAPAVDGERIYVASGIHLLALNLADGTVAWSFQTGAEVSSSPAVAGDVVYVGSDDGSIYAIDRGSGVGLWSVDTGNTISASPAVVDGAVFVGNWDGCVYAIGGPQDNDEE